MKNSKKSTRRKLPSITDRMTRAMIEIGPGATKDNLVAYGFTVAEVVAFHCAAAHEANRQINRELA